ncbi:ABC transporter ATP-binding protein [Halodurantibacterium flavum]|uniref:ABC transporter ATP-binding protein n=1 Tax=Halodurantibacterium flavum TaxID=1382802 RepID=A0ABW4S0R3_9RHOB
MTDQATRQAMLSVHELSVSYGRRAAATQAIARLSLEVGEGEMFVLLGPSGCGKTTLLRAVAGLQAPNEGRISIAGQTVFDGEGRTIPPEARPLAMVFQSYALWPHMTVFDNIAFPLREGRRGLPKGEVTRRVDEVVEMLGLATLRDRAVTRLSGGQQQRVALARALALRPRLLLMDEPLSNLDYELQVRLRSQVKELVSRVGVTTLYVTHNQSEALEMADRLAVMDGGRIRQIGTPRELYHRPQSEFVARFMGDMNLIPATVARTEGAYVLLDTPLGPLSAAMDCLPDPRPGQPCLFGIRYEDVELSTDPRAQSAVPAVVEQSLFSGASITYRLTASGQALQARLHRRYDVGAQREVQLLLPPESCLALPLEAGGST